MINLTKKFIENSTINNIRRMIAFDPLAKILNPE
jgi:hypothetical protein